MKTIELITAFIGRFHPLLVHLPIGMLLLAFLFECLSVKERYRNLKSAVQPALLWGTVFAIGSAITGFFLRQEGGYEERLANLHQNSGIATAVLALIVYVIRRRLKFWMIDPVKRKQTRIILFIPLVLLLALTGHLGGSLTHGEDYLFAPMDKDNETAADPAVKLNTIANVPDALLYRDVIQPILEARCYDCHSSRKQKGDLRLDKEEFIVRGGKHGEVIADLADSSELYKRLMLPLEDEDHMPPNEKPQLSSSEIALIKYWLEDKPLFTRAVSSHASADKIALIIESLQTAPQQSWIPSEPIKPASAKVLEQITDRGLQPMPLAEKSNYIMVNFTNSRTVTDDQLRGLQQIKDHLVWLNLSYTNISDEQLNLLSELDNLRVLHLNYTGISDVGLSQLSSLKELRLLNLAGTRITDESIPTMLKFEKLTNLFLYQTGMTNEGVAKIRNHHQELQLDSGNYNLKKLPTDTIVYKKISK